MQTRVLRNRPSSVQLLKPEIYQDQAFNSVVIFSQQKLAALSLNNQLYERSHVLGQLALQFCQEK